MTIDPKLTENGATRYAAACSAALAVGGFTRDDPALDERAKSRLRNQSLEWLSAELARRSSLVKTGDAKQLEDARLTLDYWTRDRDLVGVRFPGRVEKFPAAERQAWRDLWARVDSLLKDMPKPKPEATR